MTSTIKPITPLRQRMIDDMRIRNLADNTQSAYLQQIIAYAEHFHSSPDELGLEAIRAYQLYLTQTRKLSPSSISVITGALCLLVSIQRLMEHILCDEQKLHLSTGE
jgi:hypothetical protein